MNDNGRCGVPVLNVSDAGRSLDFYCEKVGFTKDWEHQFAEDFPIYASVSRDNLTLHLNEHGEDKSPVTLVVSVADVDAAYLDLCSREAATEGPPWDQPYGVRDFSVVDPDGHRFVFSMPLADFDDAPGRTP